MENYKNILETIAKNSKKASIFLNTLTEEQKNKALNEIASNLIDKTSEILEANERDLANAKINGVKDVMIDRLRLTQKRILDIANGVKQVIELPDPVGIKLAENIREDGLAIKKVSVPLGVILMIYEARPNVTVDAAVLALKAGNAVILRGGKEAFETNKVLVEIIQDALNNVNVAKDAVQLIPITDRKAVGPLLELKKYIDVVIPRGSAGLIQYIVNNSAIPVIETGAGVCHVYVDSEADQDKAVDIVLNAKVQRPSVCNAAETLLINKDVLNETCANILPKLWKNNVETRMDEKSYDIAMKIWNAFVKENAEFSDKKLLVKAKDEDWATEYNDLILSIKVVDNLDKAIEHISEYGTKHSEAIITENKEKANKFMQVIDASTVYQNASTRFTDGFEFGFGAEIGISTQKLHARGPMGLPVLTTYKYLVVGKGHVRK